MFVPASIVSALYYVKTNQEILSLILTLLWLFGYPESFLDVRQTYQSKNTKWLDTYIQTVFKIRLENDSLFLFALSLHHG